METTLSHRCEHIRSQRLYLHFETLAQSEELSVGHNWWRRGVLEDVISHGGHLVGDVLAKCLLLNVYHRDDLVHGLNKQNGGSRI